MLKKLLAATTTIIALAGLSIVGFAAPALAGGSDDPVPYTVGVDGLTLPSGDTFPDGGHVNITYTVGGGEQGAGIHFESKCIDRDDAECAGALHDQAQYIGQNYLPWSLFGLSGEYCITWVQVANYNEHFGEGGQSPVCNTDILDNEDASATLSTTPPTCTTGEQLVLGTVQNASWGTPTRTTGPGEYSVTATANAEHFFPGGDSTKTFAGTLDGPLSPTSSECAPDRYDPQVSVELGVCFAIGDDSSKNLYFLFDNTGSDDAVTFTVPDAIDVASTLDPKPSISVVVPAGQTAKVQTEATTQAGVSYDVYADGEFLATVNVAAFDGCQSTVPGDPSALNEVCTNGVVLPGGIWVDANPTVTYTIDGPNGLHLTDVEAFTTLPAGTYTVSVAANTGFVLDTGDTVWPYTIVILAPDHCEQTTPVAPVMEQLTCDAAGSYGFEQQTGVVWRVDGVVTAPGEYAVTAATTVTITAEPANSSWGFPENAVTSWTFEFTEPEDCDLPTFAFIPTNAVATSEQCAADGSTPTNGTITLGLVEGVSYFDQTIYTVDGEVATSATLSKPAGSYHVTAEPKNPEDTLDGADEWTLVVNAVDSALCSDIPTLPITGADSTGWLAVAIVFLQLGVALVAVQALRPRRGAHVR